MLVQSSLWDPIYGKRNEENKFKEFWKLAEAVALLTGQLLPSPEDSGSNPVIVNYYSDIYFMFIYLIKEHDKIKVK